MGGILRSTDHRRTKLAEPGNACSNPSPVVTTLGRDANVAGQPPIGRERDGVDVRRERVVIDEHSHPYIGRCAGGEHVESEMKRLILGDVVVGHRRRQGKSSDSSAVTRLDNDAHPRSVIVEVIRAIGREIEIPVMGSWRMGNVRGWRAIESISEGPAAIGGHDRGYDVEPI